jgi:hypothetical protein
MEGKSLYAACSLGSVGRYLFLTRAVQVRDVTQSSSDGRCRLFVADFVFGLVDGLGLDEGVDRF